MWICSALGFFSIVKKGKPGTWQIRARCRNDLNELATAAQLHTDIIETPDADYACRLVINQADLAGVFAALADSITYSNFKTHIASLPTQRDKLPAYHDFWSGMWNLQHRKKPTSP